MKERRENNLKNLFEEYGDLVMGVIVMCMFIVFIALFYPRGDGNTYSFGKALLMDLENAICGTR